MSVNGECLSCLVRVGFDAPDDQPIGFGDYEIVRRADGSLSELGRGAMGVTYRAVDKVLNRSVALKVIETPAVAGTGAEVRDRFLREARAAAALHHPNVAAVFHFGTTPEGDRCYYAMELVEGETLEALVRRDGPMKVEPALEMAMQVTRALVAAADHGLIHRDLKPGNIMLTRRDGANGALEVKVIDFGLAKAVSDRGNEMDLTHGAFIGTPAFASPEQFSGAAADARSDIYSLGATLWYALTGEVPCAGRTIDEIRRCQAELPLPIEKLKARQVPQSVIQLLRRILAIDPAERPASARELMHVLEECCARRGSAAIARPSPRQRILTLAAVVVLVAAAAAFFTFRSSSEKRGAGVVISDKSIAVLPFENRSGEQENAFFADGVQDEILTTLAKVADLKVISRTSVLPFREVEKRNLLDIAQQLGVAHVVEGSVQRASNRVRVTARLVDARSDTQVWAETYDRDLADVFAIQSDIAGQITRELQVTLSGAEKSAMEKRPTQDLAAFDLYTRAKTLRLTTAFSPTAMKGLLEAVELLNEAVARDPAFLLAWYELATAHDLIYFGGADHTPGRLQLAEDAVQTALRLRPDAGEAHLARAQHLYWGYLDYDGARAELELARRTLPNDPQIYSLTAFMDRRQSRWTESTRNLERALELDPRNPFTLRQMGLTYRNQRRNVERAAILDRALAIDPSDVRTRVARAAHDMHWHADTKPLRATLEAILAEKPDAGPALADDFLFLALCERDAAAAERALALFGADRVQSSNGWLSRAFSEGTLAQVRGDKAGERAAFTTARAEQQELLRTRPDYAPALCVLGMIEAALGNKEEALRVGRRAMEILPVERDSMDGADMIEYFAMNCAWAGEKELALQHLAIVAKIPSSLSYGQLRLSPYWDRLRDDPRFEEIVASLAPKPGT